MIPLVCWHDITSIWNRKAFFMNCRTLLFDFFLYSDVHEVSIVSWSIFIGSDGKHHLPARHFYQCLEEHQDTKINENAGRKLSVKANWKPG